MAKRHDNSRKRRKYYLGKENVKRPQKMMIRNGMVVKYKALVEEYRTVEVHKQFFKIMEAVREDDVYVTKAEVVAILRDGLSVNQPTAGELNHLNTETFHFRKWFGGYHIMVAYAQRMKFEGYDIQWVYKPIKNLREYAVVAGRHIGRVISGLEQRDEDNRAILALSKREADKRIKEASKEIDMEVEFGGKDDDKRK